MALLAILLIGADSGRDTSQLLKNAEEAQSPASLLWFAAKNGSSAAQSRLVAYATSTGSEYWLNKLVSLGNADAAWALYHLIGDDAKSDKLMQLAAVGNVPEAQMEFAFNTEDPQKREAWLKRAANQGYLPGQAALADWYLLNGEPDKAMPWFRVTANDYPQSAFQYGRMLWDQGNREAAISWIDKSAEQGHVMAAKVKRVLAKYQPTSPANVTKSSLPSQCLQRIGVFATSLSTIVKADSLVQAYKQDNRLQSIPLCIDKPIWLKQKTLSCRPDWQGANRLGCDVRPLANAVERRDYTHAIIVAEQGKANVNNGVMFLDLTDAYSVFVHELAHFAGFVDEYALGSKAAERNCKAMSVPNLIFDDVLAYAPMSTYDNWQQLQPGVGVWPAQTCARSNITAYKPSGRVTFLEHHDSGEIPPIYLALWRQQLTKPAAQRPVYMNLFQRFQKAGQTRQAGKWLAKYEGFLKPPMASKEQEGRPGNTVNTSTEVSVAQ